MKKQDIYAILDRVYFDERHEHESIENLPLILDDGGMFVDVGSSLGQYPFFLNQMFGNLNILAFEADSIRFEELAKRCADWQRQGGNTIEARFAAVTDHTGTVSFYSTQSNVSGSLVDTDFSQRFAELRELTEAGAADRAPPQDRSVIATDVPAVTLDQIALDCTPDLVKIDVEGAELQVIRGAKRLMEIGQTAFLVEIDRRADNAELFRLFSESGYQYLKFFNHTLFYHPQRKRRIPKLRILLGRIRRKILRVFGRLLPGAGAARGTSSGGTER